MKAWPRCGLPGVVEYSPDWLERTAMGWLVDADGLYELLVRLSKDAPGLPLSSPRTGVRLRTTSTPRALLTILSESVTCTSTSQRLRAP